MEPATASEDAMGDVATKRTEARHWLDSHGFGDADGGTWTNDAGERIGDLLRADASATQCTYWLYEDDPLGATAVEGHYWPDSSAIIITDCWWDIVEPAGGAAVEGWTGGGMRVLSDEEMDQEAEQAAPAVVDIVRGSYAGTSDDRADRWYWQRRADRAVDRRGRGYATIREAVEAAPDVLREEYGLLVDELGGPTAVSRALGGTPGRESISHRVHGTRSARVELEQVFSLRYLVEHPEEART